MIITEEKLNEIKNVEKTCNAILVFCAVVSIAAMIATFLCRFMTGGMQQTNQICLSISVGIVIVALAIMGAVWRFEKVYMLKKINLKKGQILYEIVYDSLDIAAVTVSGINTNDLGRLITVNEEGRCPEHKNLYLDEECARKAIDCFLESFYKDVCRYVDYDGSLSSNAMGWFRGGYMDYLSNKKPKDPTKYDVGEVVVAIEAYYKKKINYMSVLDNARAALKNRL